MKGPHRRAGLSLIFGDGSRRQGQRTEPPIEALAGDRLGGRQRRLLLEAMSHGSCPSPATMPLPLPREGERPCPLTGKSAGCALDLPTPPQGGSDLKDQGRASRDAGAIAGRRRFSGFRPRLKHSRACLSLPVRRTQAGMKRRFKGFFRPLQGRNLQIFFRFGVPSGRPGVLSGGLSEHAGFRLFNPFVVTLSRKSRLLRDF